MPKPSITLSLDYSTRNAARSDLGWSWGSNLPRPPGDSSRGADCAGAKAEMSKEFALDSPIGNCYTSACYFSLFSFFHPFHDHPNDHLPVRFVPVPSFDRRLAGKFWQEQWTSPHGYTPDLPPFQNMNMSIKIIDYKAGNAPSVLHAITHLGYEAAYVRCPQEIAEATHIILPGVGSAKATMDSLRELKLINALEESVLRKKNLFLGICVGMQILFEHSEEEDTDCLGWLKGQVVKFDGSRVRVPQMGWNQVRFVKDVPDEVQNQFFYFVNSYYAKPEEESDLWGTADYHGQFAAAVCRNNIYAAQFHVEKSGKAGLALLKNFLDAPAG